MKLGLYLCAALALGFVSSASADTVYDYTFTTVDVTIAGTITVNSGEVTGITGTVSGLLSDSIYGISPNPYFPGTSNLPDGNVYDNVFNGGADPLDINGLAFTTSGAPGSVWNIYSNGSAANYGLLEVASNGTDLFGENFGAFSYGIPTAPAPNPGPGTGMFSLACFLLAGRMIKSRGLPAR